MKDWYVIINETQQGPFSPEEIHTMIAGGQINPQIFAWKEGMDNWLPIAQIPELAVALAGSEPEEKTERTISPVDLLALQTDEKPLEERRRDIEAEKTEAAKAALADAAVKSNRRGKLRMHNGSNALVSFLLKVVLFIVLNTIGIVATALFFVFYKGDISPVPGLTGADLRYLYQTHQQSVAAPALHVIMPDPMKGRDKIVFGSNQKAGTPIELEFSGIAGTLVGELTHTTKKTVELDNLKMARFAVNELPTGRYNVTASIAGRKFEFKSVFLNGTENQIYRDKLRLYQQEVMRAYKNEIKVALAMRDELIEMVDTFNTNSVKYVVARWRNPRQYNKSRYEDFVKKTRSEAEGLAAQVNQAMTVANKEVPQIMNYYQSVLAFTQSFQVIINLYLGTSAGLELKRFEEFYGKQTEMRMKIVTLLEQIRLLDPVTVAILRQSNQAKIEKIMATGSSTAPAEKPETEKPAAAKQ